MTRAGLVRHPWKPVVGPASRVLVLGTMPSQASLNDGFYYGHKMNAFWPIMQELFGVARSLPPGQRGAAIASKGLALWDVLSSCIRPTALDADISEPEPNDFDSLLREHPRIETVCFNGAAAENLFVRHVGRPSASYRLPSTSATNTKPFPWKLAEWRRVLCGELGLGGGAR